MGSVFQGYSDSVIGWFSAAGLLAAGAGLWFCGRLRAAKWRRILGEPASNVMDLREKRKGRPGWVKTIPKDAKIKGDRPLFESLYRHVRAETRLRLPRALGLAMDIEERDVTAPETAAPAKVPLTDEDKIGPLLNAKLDPAVAVPTEAIAQSLVVNLVNVLKGKKKLSVGLEHAVWDSLGAGGGFAGAKLGGLFGMALAPMTVGISATLTPVWILLGAWFGSIAGKKAGNHFRSRRYFAAARRLRRAALDFRRWFLRSFPEFFSELDREFSEANERIRERSRQEQSTFVRFFYPSFMTVFYRECRARLSRDRLEERKRFVRIRAYVKHLDPVAFASLLVDIDDASVKEYPEIAVYRAAYVGALTEMREIENQANEAHIPSKTA